MRRGLGMRDRDSVVDRIGSWFCEASEKEKRIQLLVMKRSIHSVNELLKFVAWLVYREKPQSRENLFAPLYMYIIEFKN